MNGNVGFGELKLGHRPSNSTRIDLQILLNIPVLGRGVNYCIVSPRIKDLRSQLCFLSLPPSITVVSEKKNNLIKNNKNLNYDSTEHSYRPMENIPIGLWRTFYRPMENIPIGPWRTFLYIGLWRTFL